MPIRQSWEERRGGLVRRVFWYAKVIAHGARASELPAYIALARLPTVVILEARYNSHSHLQARYSSRFLLPTHHPQHTHCAHIVTAGSIGANDLKRQGQRYLTQCLRQWKYRTRVDGCLDGLGFLTSLYSSDFPSLILVIILMYLFGFEKLDALLLLDLGDIALGINQTRWNMRGSDWAFDKL